jgi:hypothetical protein
MRELSQVPPGYKVDPINDLRPVCPNCHAMIHRGTGPALTVDELGQQLHRYGAPFGGVAHNADGTVTATTATADPGTV